eukprot:gb/GFBE01080320.1/.p1 GENE.gb/GFBE01080320.1/~~gb/GFBE01080320.1/.p1  ORF type:complete len:202 (+),score=46.05 gb/GFBE01080320.1/:1-606(+)
MISSLFPKLVSGSPRAGLHRLYFDEKGSADGSSLGGSSSSNAPAPAPLSGAGAMAGISADGRSRSSGSTANGPVWAKPKQEGRATAEELEEYVQELETKLAGKSALMEELQQVQRSLGARLLKLDEGLRGKDVQLTEWASRFEESQRESEEWRRRAENAEEEMAVLRRLLVARTEEAERLRAQLAAKSGSAAPSHAHSASA